ncbi:MAG: AraC family transcriptional regulator, partial [Pseudomonadales bacterium]
MTENYTTIGGFALMIAKALDAEGKNSKALLSASGIDWQLLSNPDHRVPVDQIGRLMDLSVQETEDPAFGLKAGTHVCPTTFHALSMSMWLSPSLKEAFVRGVRYGQLLSDAGQATFEERDDEYVHSTTFVTAEKEFLQLLHPAAFDALFSAVLSFCRAISDASLTPKRVALIRPYPDNPRPYLEFFGCPIDFSQPTMSLTFDKSALDKPLPSSHPELGYSGDSIPNSSSASGTQHPEITMS